MYKIKKRICINCKNTYLPTGTTQKYCKKCKDIGELLLSRKYQKQRKEELGWPKHKICLICNKKFKYIHIRKRFCSTKCQIKFYIRERRKERIKNRIIYKKNCKFCGKIFSTNRINKNYCSLPCSRKNGINARLRFKILKRDNFTCQYCGGKAPNVILQVDHKLPVSKGGKNNDDNLITACHLCNVGKSNIY